MAEARRARRPSALRARLLLPTIGVLAAGVLACGEPASDMASTGAGGAAVEATSAAEASAAEASAAEASSAEGEPAPAPVELAGTTWQLVEFQSSSDEVGTLTPADPALYTMSLGRNGSVSFQLDCNSGSGSWRAEPSDAESGSFTLGPLAVTRALCQDEGLGERVARDAEYVRSYLQRGGRLHLSLFADGGIYMWESVGDG